MPYGSLVDRDVSIQFSFEGQSFSGLQGDTIASALIANGQNMLSRSFKYHRPRGILSMAGQDANTLVQLPSGPNVLADREPIAPGLKVSAQNCNGSLQNDRNAIIGRFSRFLPVGFYYKTFFRPRGVWEYWSRFIRRKAGLGVLDTTPRNDYFDKQYGFCDVAVIGGGPGGLAAAQTAARSGADVWLIDENPILGGSLNFSRPDAEGRLATEIRDELVTAINAESRVHVLTDALCNGYFEDNWLAIVQGNRLHKLRAKEVILCPGSTEQPAIFRNNDLPGVMLGSAAQRLIHLYAVQPGRAAVILAGNDDAYGIALDLLDAGIEVRLVADLRRAASADSRFEAVAKRGVEIRLGHAIYEALAADGNRSLRAVEVRKITSDGVCGHDKDIVDCDLLCMSVGYMPMYQLAGHGGARLTCDESGSSFSLTGLPPHCYAAGSANGNWSLDNVLASAAHAANLATGRRVSDEAPQPDRIPEPNPNYHWPVFAHPDGKEFVDFDEDLQIADIQNAVADGFEHVELVKRYSTCGMGPSQGRHSALAVARIVAQATGKSVADTGVTTARPPFAAERLGHSAGRAFYPARRSNIHHRHIETGAQLLHAGAWYRPAYYGTPDDRSEAIGHEVRCVRENVGLIDVSTLGGIDIRGPEAGEFLDRIYTFRFSNQPVGRSRYALMTNEAGIVIDDGVACRLHERHFYVTATTTGADRVYREMLKWNAQWRMDIDVTNVTSTLAAVNLAGPRSREVLRSVCDDVDLDNSSFPYMGVQEGLVAGIPARLIRVGFVGELGYEIHVPQLCGEALWDALLDAGKPFGISPFGVEAQRVLRLEKGHIIIGQDTDALSSPAEIDMSWAVSRKKGFFVGGRTIEEHGKRPLQRKLCGFVVNRSDAATPRENQLVVEGAEMLGRVTSCEQSPTLGKVIGLAYLPPGKTEIGQVFQVRSDGGTLVTCTVVPLPFYDPGNSRQGMHE